VHAYRLRALEEKHKEAAARALRLAEEMAQARRMREEEDRAQHAREERDPLQRPVEGEAAAVEAARREAEEEVLWCYSSVTVVSQWCHIVFTRLLHCIYTIITLLLNCC
jgi:hypothetical protein